jgi:E1A/CREB-binding protein
MEATLDIPKQHWLLFLRHCSHCALSESECARGVQCKFGKLLWAHMHECIEFDCEYPRCVSSRQTVQHHLRCRDPACIDCVQTRRRAHATHYA